MKEPLTTKQKLRKIFVNKYAITLYLFAIIYLLEIKALSNALLRPEKYARSNKKFY